MADARPDAPSVDDAFQQLLMEHVLPLASRRCPDNVEVFLNNEEVQAMYEYYSDALEAIFQFYASSSAIKRGGDGGRGQGGRRGGGGLFWLCLRI